MINFDKHREAIKHKPAVSKEQCLGMITDLENQMKMAMINEERVMVTGKVYRPSEIARYDLVTNYICNQPHPCIVFKVDADYAYAISMSTSEAPHNVFAFKKSRMFGNKSHLTNTVVRMKKEDAVSKFVGIFDNRKEADEAFAAVRRFYKDLFKL